MRIAMLSDIHGNSIALDAVLEDIQLQGDIDEYWVLGDLFNQGYDPVGVVERLARLSPLRCVSGNTDRYSIVGGRRGPSFERLMANPDLMQMLESAEQGNGWARGAVTATGWYEWLRDMPFEQRLTLPDGTRLLGVHASLMSDELVVVKGVTTEEEAAEMFPDCQADLVFAGHAHAESDVTFNGVRFITLGGIANSLTSDKRAKYAILEADESGYKVIRRPVEFDYASVIDAIKAAHHPSEPWLLKFYQRVSA